MAYRIYQKCYCDIPGCEGKASDNEPPVGHLGFMRGGRARKNGDVIPPIYWYPGYKTHEPVIPVGWRYERSERAGMHGLWICPKHKIEVTVDGQGVKDVLEDRETFYKLRGQS